MGFSNGWLALCVAAAVALQQGSALPFDVDKLSERGKPSATDAPSEAPNTPAPSTAAAYIPSPAFEPTAVGPPNFPNWPPRPAPMPIIPCDPSQTVTVRYAETTKRMYIENENGTGGCMDLSTAFEMRKDTWDGAPLGGARGPLWPVDPETGERTPNVTGTWLLTEDLYVEDGVTLNILGGKNGDCDQLRLLSSDTNFLNLRAHGANLYIKDTEVVGWDELADAPRPLTNFSQPRSYISAVSEVITDKQETCEGKALNNMGEARMDIINSEVSYLGYYESESYGLTWKVRGFCQDKSNPEIFDDVNVYGDILYSNIHHNYFGMYSYGHQAGNWSYNKMHDNYQYGFDPHDDSDWLTIHNNEVWDNGNHNIIASKRCNHVSIQNNHVYGGALTGIFLHRSSDFTIVRNNYVHDNADAGMAVLEGFYLNVYDNVFENNYYGIRFSVGSMYNWVHHNSFLNNTKYNIYTYMGSDLADVEGSDGRNYDIWFTENLILGDGGWTGESVRLKQADDIVVLDNKVEEAHTLRFDNCTQILWNNNDIHKRNVEIRSVFGTCFASGSDPGFRPICGDEPHSTVDEAGKPDIYDLSAFDGTEPPAGARGNQPGRKDAVGATDAPAETVAPAGGGGSTGKRRRR